MPEDSSNDGGGFIRVSNREIYDSLQTVKTEIVGIRADLHLIMGENVELRRRVRGLELRVYTILAGMLTALMAGAFALARGMV